MGIYIRDENTKLNMMDDNCRSRLYVLWQFANVCILFVLISFAYFSWDKTEFHYNWAMTISIMSIVLLAYHICMFKPFRFRFLEYRTWFILLSYLFMFGRVYLHGFNFDENMYWDLSLRYSEGTMYQAGLVIICNLQALFIGFSYCKRQSVIKKSFSTFSEKYSIDDINRLVFQSGVLLACLTLPFRLIEDAKAIIETQTSGTYSALTGTSGITDDIAALFVPGIVYMIAGICETKKSKRIATIILLSVVAYFVIVMILTGDRRYQVTAIIAIYLCYIRITDLKINFRKLILFAVLGIVFLDFLTMISSIRLGNLTSLSDFLVYYIENNRENSVIYTTLRGFGLTFFSVVGIVQNIPDYVPYQLGLSFYGAIPSILPIGWLIGDFFRQVSISNVINSITGHPVGGSLIGDLYANFGMLSIIFAIVAGVFLSKIFKVDDGRSKALSVAKYYSLFYILINLVRGSFFESFRGAITAYFIPLLIIAFLKSITKKRKLT